MFTSRNTQIWETAIQLLPDFRSASEFSRESALLWATRIVDCLEQPPSFLGLTQNHKEREMIIRRNAHLRRRYIPDEVEAEAVPLMEEASI